jgi:hypothetical protein
MCVRIVLHVAIVLLDVHSNGIGHVTHSPQVRFVLEEHNNFKRERRHGASITRQHMLAPAEETFKSVVCAKDESQWYIKAFSFCLC